MKITGHSYKQHSIRDEWDTIVIGSGIGGLAVAALLAREAGQRVLVLERHYTAGGFTHAFRRPGYEWDAGVHYVGRVTDEGSPVRAAFDNLTEGRLGWSAMPEVYDRISIGERTYDFHSGLGRFRDGLVGDFPGEAKGIDGYIAAVCATAQAANRYFAEKAIPGPLAKLIGPMLRAGFLKGASRTTGEVIREFTRNRELAGVLAGQWGDYGLPPGQSSFGAHALVAHHYFGGVGYPVGGASEIAAGFAPAIEAAGGEILISAEVAEILLDSGAGGGTPRAIGVKMADGRELRAKTVISDAGADNTFNRLLPRGLRAVAELVEQMRAVPASIGHVCLYVGVKRGPGEAEFDAANRWFYTDPDHDANYLRYMADPESAWPCLFVSFPSAKEPTFAQRYPGRSTIEVIAPVPYAGFAKWAETKWKRRGADYEEFKRALAERLRADLEARVPATRGRIDYAEVSTPLSTRHFANFAKGEIYGLSATPKRYQLRALGARTPVRNLYLTGSDAASSGVVGAMFGGVIAASAILGKNLVSTVSKPRARQAMAKRAA